ncbi:MAG: RNA-binding S4 domain-containing protein [Bacteroidales bacterium]|nr:RNA-binding S4 domain-containing protein [Bacteroidales bacterium]
MAEGVRIDKFLWAVRLYKTRTIAAEAVKRGKVSIGGSQVKSSRVVKVGDVISLKVPAATRSFEIIKTAQSRMGAKLVADHIREVTPQGELDKIDIYRMQMQNQRRKGLGRPTKKERRDIDEYVGEVGDEWDIDFGDWDDDMDDIDIEDEE